MSEDAREIVGDSPHHEAIEERDRTARARAREYPSGGEEAVTGKRLGESFRPLGALLGRLGRGGGTRDPGPAVLHRAVDGRPVRRFEPVLHVPNLVGKACHRPSSWTMGR